MMILIQEVRHGGGVLRVCLSRILLKVCPKHCLKGIHVWAEVAKSIWTGTVVPRAGCVQKRLLPSIRTSLSWSCSRADICDWLSRQRALAIIYTLLVRHCLCGYRFCASDFAVQNRIGFILEKPMNDGIGPMRDWIYSGSLGHRSHLFSLPFRLWFLDWWAGSSSFVTFDSQNLTK